MLTALLWNLLLTAGLALLLAAVGRLPSLRRRPALRHCLWLLLLAKLITPPLVGVPLLPALVGSDTAAVVATPPVKPAEHREFNAVAEVASASTDRDAGRVAAPELESRAPAFFLGGLLAVSLLGTCVLLTIHGVHAVRLYRWLKRAGTENAVLAQCCAEVAASLAVRGPLRSCVVDARTTPLLWAWRGPLVVVPRQFLDDLSPPQLRSVVAHELAHLRRRDHWANLFVFLVKTLLWWNPVVWWADRELRAAQELCCDAMAIDCCKANRRSYATTLLKALDFIQAEPWAPRALAAGMGSKKTILRRFEMIAETRLSYHLSRGTFLLLLLLAIPLVCMPVRGQEKAPAAPATPAAGGGAKAAAAKPAAAKPAAPTPPLASKKAQKRQGEMVMGVRPQGKCSISGKVVSAASGEPVAGARMYLHYNVTHGSIFINTASDGTFVLKNIPQGPFSLRSSHTAGYQDAIYNPAGKPGPWPDFSLAEGEQRTGVVLKAQQACRISGKVVDENGQLLENIETLTVLAWFQGDDGTKYHSEQARVNRKDGSYLLDGLSNKPAYVMAINWQAAAEGDACPPIYYPSTFSRNDAKLITFEKSRSAEDVNITLRKEGGLVLEGTVRDDAGKPVPDAFVVVHHRDMLFDFVTAYSDEQGHYQIQGLGEGAFQIHVDAVQRGYVRTRTPIDLDKAHKKTQRDLTLTRGASISGKLVDEKGKTWRIGESYGYATVIKEQPKKKASEQHGSFTLTGFGNKYRIRDTARASGCSFSLGEGNYYDNAGMTFPTKSTFVLQGLMPGHTILGFLPKKEHQKVTEIRYDGEDVLKSGIDTKPGQEIKDVTIVIGTGE